MIIKDYNCTKSTITEFELIGNDELALSKAFSYLLSINFNIFTIFLKALGIKNWFLSNLVAKKSILYNEDKIFNIIKTIGFALDNFDFVIKTLYNTGVYRILAVA